MAKNLPDCQHGAMQREQAIPILRVGDATAAAEWYSRLGFEVTSVHRFAEGLPAFVTLERGDVTIFLSEHEGDASPDTLVYLRVENCAELAEALGVTPHENPWGPEFELRDPDGNRLRINTPSWW